MQAFVFGHSTVYHTGDQIYDSVRTWLAMTRESVCSQLYLFYTYVDTRNIEPKNHSNMEFEM